MKHFISQIESLEARQLMSGASRFYFFGNSMTNGLDFSSLQDLMTSDGSTITWGRQSKGGASTASSYYLDSGFTTSGYDPARPSNPDPWGNWTNAFTNTWDAVVFQPHERKYLTEAKVVNGVTREEGEVPSIIRFMEQIAVKSPNAQIYVYSRPAIQATTSADYSATWNKTYAFTGAAVYDARYSRSSVTQLVPLLRQAQLADPLTHKMPLVKIIPAGETYYNIDQMIKAGRFAGTPVNSINNFYVDFEHPTLNLGAYALALTYSSVLRGLDPRGQIVPNNYLPQTGPLSNQTVVKLVQEAVYNAIHDNAYANYTSAMPGDAAKPGAISVRTFNDVNKNGIADLGETSLGGMLIYIDRNNNSLRDADEFSAITDAKGNAYFAAVSAGSYVIRSNVPAGYTQFNAGVTVAVSSFKNSDVAVGFTDTPAVTSSLRVRVMTASQANLIRDTDSPISGMSVYIDLNNDGLQDPTEPVQITNATGFVRFDNLLAGSYRVNLIGQPQTATVTLVAGAITDSKIGLAGYVSLGDVHVNVYQDTNRNGVMDLAETALPGVTVFLDSDNDGRIQPTELSFVSDATGLANFISLAAGTYRTRAIAPTGYYVSGVSVDASMVLSVSQSNVSIGIAPTPVGLLPGAIKSGKSSIGGMVYNDKNADGYWQTGDLGVAGRTVWIDGNNNGLLDPGEPTTLTTSTGKYTFGNLAGGVYYVRQVVPADQVQTYPFFNKSFKVTVAPSAYKNVGDFRTGVPVIVPPPPPGSASISGLLYFDNNKNAIYDKGDQVQGGKLVYIDTNGNNVMDATELRTTTNEVGAFSFTGLNAGTFKIRRVVPAGYKVITAPADITVIAGQVVTGVMIGTIYG